MIEKLNKVLNKLPPEYRDIMREAFEILIEEVINTIIKDNERIWQTIERVWQAIEKLEKSIQEMRKTIEEGFERQERENQRIWQTIEKVWQAIDRLEKSIEQTRKDMKEGFERQERENQRIWQAIEKLTQAIDRLDKKIDRKITSLGARWGLMVGIKTIIEDLGYAVENIVFFDEEGYVFLKPSQVEIDIIIKDSKKIAIEIKSSISEGDVSAFDLLMIKQSLLLKALILKSLKS